MEENNPTKKKNNNKKTAKGEIINSYFGLLFNFFVSYKFKHLPLNKRSKKKRKRRIIIDQYLNTKTKWLIKESESRGKFYTEIDERKIRN